MKITRNKTLGSTFLVAGTSIGAGMLALPISTGSCGFFYSAALFIGCFLFMLASVFLLLEVNLWSHKISANLITLAKERLGIVGQIVAWAAFLLLLYAVASAYLSGGGSLLAEVFSAGLNMHIPTSFGVLLFMVIFGFLVVFGTKTVDVINRILIVGLIVAFFLLLIFTTPHIQASNLKGGDPVYLMAAVPIVILSFTSHLIVPSLRTYLTGDVVKLKKALFFGSLIPLVCYLVWEVITLGILPTTGPNSLEVIAKHPHAVSGLTHALNLILQKPMIALLFGLFSFFALVTSFFGVALSLYDFLSDGMHIKKTPLGKCLLLLIMFLPPVLFALFFETAFVLAIGYAGVFVAVLYGLMPSIMVWKGRYIEKLEEKFTVPFGKPLLVIIFIGSLAVIFFQIGATNHWLPTP